MDPRQADIPDSVRQKRGGVEFLCPFGCTHQKCNHVGYCRHLVGFSIDGKTVELRERYGHQLERTGVLIRPVEAGDRLVGTMVQARRNTFGQHVPTPTFRVYREDGRAPVLDDGVFERRADAVSNGWDGYEQVEEETNAAATA